MKTQPQASLDGCIAFSSGKYNSATRELVVQFANVPAGDAGLIMGLLSLWSDPAHATRLAGLKVGTHCLSLEAGQITVRSGATICAPQLN